MKDAKLNLPSGFCEEGTDLQGSPSTCYCTELACFGSGSLQKVGFLELGMRREKTRNLDLFGIRPFIEGKAEKV